MDKFRKYASIFSLKPVYTRCEWSCIQCELWDMTIGIASCLVRALVYGKM